MAQKYSDIWRPLWMARDRDFEAWQLQLPCAVEGLDLGPQSSALDSSGCSRIIQSSLLCGWVAAPIKLT